MRVRTNFQSKYFDFFENYDTNLNLNNGLKFSFSFVENTHILAHAKPHNPYITQSLFPPKKIGAREDPGGSLLLVELHGRPIRGRLSGYEPGELRGRGFDKRHPERARG